MKEICELTFLEKSGNVTCSCGERFKDAEIKENLGNERYE